LARAVLRVNVTARQVDGPLSVEEAAFLGHRGDARATFGVGGAVPKKPAGGKVGIDLEALEHSLGGLVLLRPETDADTALTVNG
jgi:hypothetical protein